MASEDANSMAEVVSVDLPAPEGWRKKFTPKKGGTPRRNEITFMSPTGEEIVNKRQLDQYLRGHPGGPPSSEFDWGTGDTPRRSSRLSGSKDKATESPEGEKATKRERKSSGKKGTKDKEKNACEAAEEAKGSAVGEMNMTVEKAIMCEAAEEAKESAVAGMKDNEDSIDMTAEKAIMSEAEEVSKEKRNENVEDKVEQEKENCEILPKDSEKNALEAAKDAAKGSEDDEMKENEGKDLGKERSEKADEEPGEKGSVNAEKEKPESFEQSKQVEAATGESEKDGHVLTENDSSKENQERGIPMETQHSPVNYNDGKHQPEAPPVNC